MDDCNIKLYRSATLGIKSKNFSLLFDPWLTDGEYYGSWSHFPPFDLKENLSEINSYDAIYISHIHPDHCSEDTLKYISKDIPIYILEYHSKFLKFKIERLGFKVIEISNFEELKLSESFSIKAIAADNCDPELCYKFNGCADLNVKNQTQQIDSLTIIKCNGKNILNINDCPYDLAKFSLSKINKNYKIDLMLLGYGGAGPFPQCYENLNHVEKIKAAEKKQINFLEMSKKFIEDIKPDFYLPFAGTYYLSGQLSNLQNLRGVPSLEKAYNFLENNLHIKSECIKLNPDSSYNLSKNTYSDKYKEISENEMQNYINNVLSKKKLNYEDDAEVTFDTIIELSKKAHLRFLKKVNDLKIKLDFDVLLKFRDKYIHINNKKKSIEEKNKKDLKDIDKFVIYDVHPKLLKRILLGPKYAHWNNAEIGSHIKFFRKPDYYDRRIYNAMSFFHS